MQLQDFDFALPPELIAQVPAARRDQARLMVVDRTQQRVTHTTFTNLGNYLHPGDVLVVNDTEVIPARLRGRKVGTGGKVEVLLLHELQHELPAVSRQRRRQPEHVVQRGVELRAREGLLRWCVLLRQGVLLHAARWSVRDGDRGGSGHERSGHGQRSRG